MVVSGMPLGGVQFVDCFLEKRLQKTSSDLKKISIGSVFAAPRRGSYCSSRATCKCGSFSRHSSLLLSSGRSSFGLTTRSTPPSTSTCWASRLLRSAAEPLAVHSCMRPAELLRSGLEFSSFSHATTVPTDDDMTCRIHSIKRNSYSTVPVQLQLRRCTTRLAG